MVSLVKQCRDCEVIKDVKEFYLNKGIPQNPCKACTKKNRKSEYAENTEKVLARNKRHYLKNRDKYIGLMAEYRLANKEAISAIKKAWWQKNRDVKVKEMRERWWGNREAFLARAKEWRAHNKEWIRVNNARYQEENKDAIAARHRIYYKNNKDGIYARNAAWLANPENQSRYKKWKKLWTDKHREQNRDYYAAKAHKRRASKRSSGGFYTANQIAEMYKGQKGLCNTCKCELNGKYHHDHIVPLVKQGGNGIDNIQLLCPNCNLRKRDMDNDKFIEKLRGLDFA